MAHRGLGRIVGTAGYAVSVLLVAAAAAAVIGDDRTPTLAWDPQANSQAGFVRIEPRPAGTEDQDLLVVHLEGIPEVIAAGDTIFVQAIFTNGSARTVSLEACPTYRLAISHQEGDVVPEEPEDFATQILGQLDCESGAELDPGEEVRVEIPFFVEPFGFPAPRTEVTVWLELWPRVEGGEYHPVSQVAGLTVERPDEDPFGGGGIPFPEPQVPTTRQ